MGKKGYEMKDDTVVFILEDHRGADDVFVVGNFMGWEAGKEDWRMEWMDGRWELEVERKRLSGEFDEFTFVVDGEWLDADKEAENVNYCAGHGYRYVIS